MTVSEFSNNRFGHLARHNGGGITLRGESAIAKLARSERFDYNQVWPGVTKFIGEISMSNSAFRTLSFVGIVMIFQLSAAGDEVDFSREISPILKTRCSKCHGFRVREGGLRFANRRDALAETDSGNRAIVPGDPNSSGLLARIISTDQSEMMPPEGERLSGEEIAVIKQWIKEGASWPEDANEKHWAYVAPQRGELPKVKLTEWSRNAIDDFVLKKLERNEIAPASESEPARLIRRVSLALTGIPPTVEQVDAFISDPSDSRYEQFVDQCLESPRYGERWAQPWLDLARYADSNGYQADQLRDSWAYRDWVIEAINRDQPFDQFAVEQLAGDLIPDATPDQKIATGFHRTVTCNVEAGVHPEENRVNQVFDRVNTTATVFLGTTIECCQCHNHKYDPFTQDEFYQLFAFFNNTPVEVKLESGVQYNFWGPSMDLPLSPDDEARKKSLESKLVELENQKSELARLTRHSRNKLKADLVKALETPVRWETMEVVEFESTGGETFDILQDNSVLIGGSLPDTTTYNVKATSGLDRITAFRIEALTHESLPGTGPGRGDVKRANFILSELTVGVKSEAADSGAVFTDVTLNHPAADFSQAHWDVSAAIDGDRTTGWAVAPRFFVNHWASFALESPIERKTKKTKKTKFQFLLDQNYGRGRTIGRIRISATDSESVTLAVPDEVRKILALKNPDKAETRKLDEFLQLSEPEMARLANEIGATRKQLSQVTVPTTLVMVEMDKPRETFKLNRGEYLNPGKKVVPGVPAALHPFNDLLPGNRLGLAKWIVDPANPLIGRVTVNRWWSIFFGQGLVLSGEDFGTQCDSASHPELLDWLAVEFVENGWSRKHVHKLIVMSSTFRQSSSLRPELWDIDPKNQLYARGPRFRMPAEMIRDNGLAISGLLSSKMGGPPVMPFQPENIWRTVGRNGPKWTSADDDDRFRRGVYVVWRRAAPYPSFINFDAPDRATCVVDRPRTNTPLQALTLLNDQAFLEMAVALADRVSAANPNGLVNDRIIAAMRSCVARIPNDNEIQWLRNLYEMEKRRFENSPASSHKFLNSMRHKNDLNDAGSNELAALSIVCNVLLNLDETINY